MPLALAQSFASDLSTVGGVAYLQRLVENAASHIAPTFEAEQLARAYRDRQAREAITALVDAVSKGADPHEAMEATKMRLAIVREIPPGTRVLCGDRGNIGEVLADNGDTCTVHFVSPEGVEVDKELQKDELTPLDGPAAAQAAFSPTSISELIQRHPDLRHPIIDGVMRRGETINVVAPPKIGKSWLVMSLAISAGFGLPWIGFPVERVSVLLLDNELHEETLATRMRWLAHQRGLNLSQARIDVISLRGKGQNLLTLEPTLVTMASRGYGLIVYDAWYRFLPRGYSENENADVMHLYNVLDRYAAIADDFAVDVEQLAQRFPIRLVLRQHPDRFRYLLR